jgi:4-oxalocrotonate tautomerase
MPLARITIPKGKTPEYRKAISQGVHSALVEAFKVPQDDLFQIITEGAPQADIVHAPSYLGIAYTDDLILIQITVTDSRTVEQKKHLFRRIADHLAERPRPQAPGHLHQSAGGKEGELVVRDGRGAIRLEPL